VQKVRNGQLVLEGNVNMWLDYELDFIRNNLHLQNDDIGKYLNRSAHDIALKKHELGLRKNGSVPDGYVRSSCPYCKWKLVIERVINGKCASCIRCRTEFKFIKVNKSNKHISGISRKILQKGNKNVRRS